MNGKEEPMSRLNKDIIYRQAAIEALLEKGQRSKRYRLGDIWELNFDEIREAIATVPSAQPEPAIPLSWIEGQIEWLKSLDNAFSTLTAVQISAMVNKWKEEQNE